MPTRRPAPKEFKSTRERIDSSRLRSLKLQEKIKEKNLSILKQKSFWVEPYYWDRFVLACTKTGQHVRFIIKNIIIEYANKILGSDNE